MEIYFCIDKEIKQKTTAENINIFRKIDSHVNRLGCFADDKVALFPLAIIRLVDSIHLP